VIRVAAVGDLHLAPDMRGRYRSAFGHLADHAELLLLAGDLTRHGTPEEGEVVAAEVRDLDVPVVVVLGNHDYHADAQDVLTKQLEDAGVMVLEGTNAVFDLDGVRVGVAGVKGFGGGFPGKGASEFGEPEMKAFIRHTKEVSARLGEALQDLRCDIRIALTHYSPVKDTLTGEPPEIHPFLGSYHLAEVIDEAQCDLALHGHAHLGSEKGLTPGGVRVRNVAQPVIKQAYAVYGLDPAGTPAD
jgi:Icc-related predicted phosphoesterase